jgi:hypothetical protein
MMMSSGGGVGVLHLYFSQEFFFVQGCSLALIHIPPIVNKDGTKTAIMVPFVQKRGAFGTRIATIYSVPSFPRSILYGYCVDGHSFFYFQQ